jgi:hypothetical protein
MYVRYLLQRDPAQHQFGADEDADGGQAEERPITKTPPARIH